MMCLLDKEWACKFDSTVLQASHGCGIIHTALQWQLSMLLPIQVLQLADPAIWG